jgi:hypothetical protein
MAQLYGEEFHTQISRGNRGPEERTKKARRIHCMSLCSLLRSAHKPNPGFDMKKTSSP